MARYLIVEDLPKLLEACLKPDPDMEAEYRRGYGDAVGALFQHLDDLPPEIGKVRLIESVWQWWTKLMDWQQADVGQVGEPPAFMFMKVTE